MNFVQAESHHILANEANKHQLDPFRYQHQLGLRCVNEKRILQPGPFRVDGLRDAVIPEIDKDFGAPLASTNMERFSMTAS